MSDAIVDHPLSEEALVTKARLFIGEMEAQDANSWQQGLWATMGLELLARASLAHISPVLLVRGDKWESQLYALGIRDTVPSGTVFVTVSEVFQRLVRFVPNLKEEISFCNQLIHLRNSEVHSGRSAFETNDLTELLPRFYLVCSMLMDSMGREISDICMNSKAIEAAIQSHQDTTAQSVRDKIEKFRCQWLQTPEDQREQLINKANECATSSSGHVVSCPSCESRSLLQGDEIAPDRIEIVDDNIVARKTMLPSSFECVACGLQITGYSRLSKCGLGDQFTATVRRTAGEYFGLIPEEEIWNYVREMEAEAAYEVDYNE